MGPYEYLFLVVHRAIPLLPYLTWVFCKRHTAVYAYASFCRPIFSACREISPTRAGDKDGERKSKGSEQDNSARRWYKYRRSRWTNYKTTERPKNIQRRRNFSPSFFSIYSRSSRAVSWALTAKCVSATTFDGSSAYRSSRSSNWNNDRPLPDPMILFSGGCYLLGRNFHRNKNARSTWEIRIWEM